MNKMKIIITLLGLFFLSQTIIIAQNSPVERAFIAMPDEYFLPLSINGRKSLLMTYYADTLSSYKNRFGGQSKIKVIDAKKYFLKVKNSKEGDVELKLLVKNDSVYAIALDFTTCAPICDSHIGFFSPDWKLLSYPLTPNIRLEDFVNEEAVKKDSKKVSEITNQIDLAFLQSTFYTTDQQLQITLNLENAVEEDTFKRIKSYLKGNRLHLKWNGDKYEITSCDWIDKSIK